MKLSADSVKLSLKAMLAALSVIFFLTMMFLAMDNTQRAITGETLQVYSNQDGLVVNWYGDHYLVDFSWEENAVEKIKEGWEAAWFFLPRSIRALEGIFSGMDLAVGSG